MTVNSYYKRLQLTQLTGRILQLDHVPFGLSLAMPLLMYLKKERGERS